MLWWTIPLKSTVQYCVLFIQLPKQFFISTEELSIKSFHHLRLDNKREVTYSANWTRWQQRYWIGDERTRHAHYQKYEGGPRRSLNRCWARFMVPHGAPAPNRHCCRETLSKTLDINAGQSMATLRPIKAAGLLRVWPMEGTGGKDVFKCPAPPKCPECAIIMCYCPLLRGNGCAPPRSLEKKGEESTQGCTLLCTAGAINSAQQFGSENKH